MMGCQICRAIEANSSLAVLDEAKTGFQYLLCLFHARLLLEYMYTLQVQWREQGSRERAAGVYR